MEEQRKLQVGEIVYRDYDGIIRAEKIVSVTKTKATTNRWVELRVDVPPHGQINKFKQERHGSYQYYTATPELIQKYQRQVLERKIERIDFKKLSTETLNKILELSQEVTK